MIFYKTSGDCSPCYPTRKTKPKPEPVMDDDILDNDALIRLGVNDR